MNFDYYTYNLWDGNAYGKFKTNTVLRYDNEYKKVLAWGALGLAKNPGRKKGENVSKPIELFKLSLGNLAEDLKPELPPELHLQKEQRHIRAITDYLQKMDINFSENIRLILTVPAEYSYQAKKVMRECAFKANLITKIDSDRLQFTTERGTVDLTTRKLLNNCELGEVTERAGDFCGSTFVDKEFLKFLGKIVGEEVNQKFDGTFIPLFPYQSAIKFKIFITQKYEVECCHEEGVEFLGELLVDLPDIDLGLDRKVKFSLCFGDEEIKASAINSLNGQNYHTVFNLDTES
ncbi:5838_t:CDS:2 [Racocetra fulgida]|uniref:5838_t:CDS:1 n=1 Tax=Racocetra fulgida TaxID=60492 RepID=A0A9N9C392_9GLOM|nr:5838_t:CDS:2 [Racocetra fulgida]